MTPEEIKKLADDICRNGEAWLKNAKQVADSIPFVQRTMEIAQQFSHSFSNVPSTINMTEWEPVTTALVETQKALSQGLPNSGYNPLSTAVSGSALITSAGTHATGLYDSAALNKDVAIQCWANQNLVAFERLYQTEDNKSFIRRKLKTLRSGSDVEFVQSLEEYSKTINGVTSPSSAAIAMRNVLESLYGNLLEYARVTTGLNAQQLKKWDDMAKAVARGGPTSAEAGQLLPQKLVYDMLHDQKLTKIAKNDWTPIKSDWDLLMSEFLGFLYTVLGLADLKDGA